MNYKTELHSNNGSVNFSEDAVTLISENDDDNTCFSLSVEFLEWENDAYIFLPACVYNGNQFKRIKIPYPPMYRKSDCGANALPLISDIPALNVDGSGKIEVTSGDLSVPCFGVFFKRKKKAFFIIELPEYKLPSIRKATVSMCQRGWSYIVKAGTVILVCNFAVHVMQTFNWSFESIGEDMAHTSILATIAAPFAYVIAPIIGVVAWQFAASAITGFIAKENVVGTIAVCFGIANLFDLDELAMVEGSAGEVASAFGISSVAALAFLTFNLFTPPCFAAIGAMNAELKSRKWLWAGIGLQLAVGYTVGFTVFFFGTLFTGGSFGAAWMPVVGWSVVAAIAIVIASLIIRRNRQLKKEEAIVFTTKKKTLSV